jgi:hypothetical protein
MTATREGRPEQLIVSFAMVVAIDVNRTRSSGSSTCTGNDEVM